MNIREIAKLAGVSHSTVSRVINGSLSVKPKTKELVERIMTEQGFKPNIYARGMMGTMLPTLGVVIPDFSDPFFSTMVSGIENICRRNSSQLLIAESKLTADGELEAINYLVNSGCELLIVHARALTESQLEALMHKNQGMILINRFLQAFPQRCIYFDSYLGGRLATRSILEKNYRSIAIISRNTETSDFDDRVKGVIDELQANNLEFQDHLLIQESASSQGGMIAARRLLTLGIRVDAIICYNDIMAIGVIQALRDNGFSVPKDIAVIGFDDLDVANYCVPRLSTIRYPILQMAQQAAEFAFSSLHNSDKQIKLENIWLPELISRESH